LSKYRVKQKIEDDKHVEVAERGMGKILSNSRSIGKETRGGEGKEGKCRKEVGLNRK